MATNRDRSVTCLITATTFLATSAAVFSAAGQASAVGGQSIGLDAGVTASGVIDRVSALIVEGSLVRARAMVDELLAGDGGVSMSDRERDRIFGLIGDIERGIRQADPLDISLQRAELSLIGDDLTGAERHAEAVFDSRSADERQRLRAEMVLSLVDARRDALRPVLAERLSRAVNAFEGGAYAVAKADLEQIDRSGLELGAGDQRTLDTYLARIRSIEFDRGETFDGGIVLLSMMQPGEANKTNWNEQPSTQPSQQSGQEAQVQPASMQPASQGSGQAAPPAGEDMITAARRLEAQSLLAEADQAWTNADYATAQRAYGQAVELGRGFLTSEQLARAEARRTEAAVILRGNLPSGVGLEDDINARQLARQQIEAEYANAIEQAQEALATGDASRARDHASTAKLALSQGRDLFDIGTYEAKLLEADRLLAQIADAEERQRIRELEGAQQRAMMQAEAERQNRAREVDEKIAGLIESVRAHQMEQNYEKALQEVDQILFLDPQNPSGLLLRDVLRDSMLLRRYQVISAERRPSYVQQSLDNWESTVAPQNIVNYPADWKNISRRRGDPLQFSESAANRAVLSALEDKRIPVDFTDNNLEDVLTFVANVGGVEMDIDWPSLEDIGVARESQVSLRLTNVPLETVLDRVLEKASGPDLPAGWAVTDGVLTIASDEVLRRSTVLEIYDIRDLLIEIPDYDNAPEFDLNTVFQAGGQQGGGGGGQSPFQQGQDEIERIPREELVEAITDLIQNNVDTEGWEDFGGDTGTISELAGNLVIVNTPKNHRAITGLLSKLRAVRNLQINVESRFLLINEDFFEQIGFDLDVYFSNTNEFDILRTIDPTLLPSDFFQRSEEGDFEFARVVQGSNFFDTTGDGIPDQAIGQPVFQPGTQGDSFSPIGAAQNSFGLTEGLTQGSFASDVFSLIRDGAGGPALTIAGRFLDDIQVDFLVEATQADRTSTTLTAPRLTITNGQRAYVYVATQTSFVSDLVPVVSNAAVGLDPTISVVPEGVQLDVRGVISADRRYVTVDIDTAIATATLNATQTVQAAAGGTGNIPGNGIAAGTIQLPVVTITRVQTTVTVPDQGTVLLGGQRLVNEYTTETGVPVLSKIPILNRFFTNRVESKEEQTLLILVKPTVLIQNEEEEKNFPGLLDALGG